MREFFNDYVQSLETYIMFRIKEEVARITPELIAIIDNYKLFDYF